ncbi:MAG: hypothetical protein U5K74_13005 [Gemmatimonadaceae bacterium]|nr:hypothetical protein [Gemmatimonadaceae bacterium]
MFESSVQLSPADLERDLGGPAVRNFVVRLDGGPDSLSADNIQSAQELPPSGLPIPAVERNPVLAFRDVMKIERTLQHVVP